MTGKYWCSCGVTIPCRVHPETPSLSGLEAASLRAERDEWKRRAEEAEEDAKRCKSVIHTIAKDRAALLEVARVADYHDKEQSKRGGRTETEHVLHNVLAKIREAGLDLHDSAEPGGAK